MTAWTVSAAPGSTTLHYDGLGSAIAVEKKATTPVDTAIALDPNRAPVGSTDRSAGTIPQYLGDDGHGNVTTVTGPASINCTARFDPFGTPVTNTGVGIVGATCYTGATGRVRAKPGGWPPIPRPSPASWFSTRLPTPTAPPLRAWVGSR